jgi:hypothetical protein
MPYAGIEGQQYRGMLHYAPHAQRGNRKNHNAMTGPNIFPIRAVPKG